MGRLPEALLLLTPDTADELTLDHEAAAPGGDGRGSRAKVESSWFYCGFSVDLLWT
eukprot:m.99458 g.99458  ORF g.99458 m.99458 type:complete len:56 (-) comp8720_c0_seq1:2174-2341(-)